MHTEDKEGLLSISEMAKLRKVTTETLRHYDRIGLFKPEYVDPDTGYRYYSISQYEKLGTIKELRQLGMGLDEIKEYFNHRNLEKSKKMLKDYHAQLIQKIQEMKLLEKTISEKIAFMDSFKDIPEEGKLFETDLSERSFLTIGHKYNTSQNIYLDATKLEGYMDEIAPILATNRIGICTNQSVSEIAEQIAPGERFEAAPLIFCDKRYKKSIYYHEIPAGHYVCAYYNGKWGFNDAVVRKIGSYLVENHLKQNGLMIQLYEIDITVTDQFDETVIEIQVPVKSA